MNMIMPVEKRRTAMVEEYPSGMAGLRSLRMTVRMPMRTPRMAQRTPIPVARRRGLTEKAVKLFIQSEKDLRKL